MAQFVKKPVIVEAVQWLGGPESLVEVGNFINVNAPWTVNPDRTEIYIKTLEGEMTASVGDWIIKGVKDEFYPCKPEIFVATYEAVEE